MKKKVIFTIAMAGMLCASLAGCHKKVKEATVETDYALEDETDVALADEGEDMDSLEAEYTDETDEYDDGFMIETDDAEDGSYDEYNDVADDLSGMVDSAGEALSSAQQYLQDSVRKNSNGEEPSVDDEGNLHMDGYRLIRMERETMAFNEEYVSYSNTDMNEKMPPEVTETQADVVETEVVENTEG